MQVHKITQEFQQMTLITTPAVTESENMDKEKMMLDQGTRYTQP